MTEFTQATNVITDNGVVVDQQDSPIIQVKKLNGQGTLYKLTDANFESINAQREQNSVINVDKFIRAVRSNFGVGHYNISALTHMPLPQPLQELGMIRVEINAKVMVTQTQHCFDEIESHDIFLAMEEGAVLELESWYGFIKKAYDDGEVGKDFMDLCDMVMEQAPEQVSHFFDETMFDRHIEIYDKINIVKNRVYEEDGV